MTLCYDARPLVPYVEHPAKIARRMKSGMIRVELTCKCEHPVWSDVSFDGTGRARGWETLRLQHREPNPALRCKG